MVWSVRPAMMTSPAGGASLSAKTKAIREAMVFPTEPPHSRGLSGYVGTQQSTGFASAIARAAL